MLILQSDNAYIHGLLDRWSICATYIKNIDDPLLAGLNQTLDGLLGVYPRLLCRFKWRQSDLNAYFVSLILLSAKLEKPWNSKTQYPTPRGIYWYNLTRVAILRTKIKAILSGGKCTYMYILWVPIRVLAWGEQKEGAKTRWKILAVELVASLSPVLLALVFFFSASHPCAVFRMALPNLDRTSEL